METLFWCILVLHERTLDRAMDVIAVLAHGARLDVVTPLVAAEALDALFLGVTRLSALATRQRACLDVVTPLLAAEALDAALLDVTLVPALVARHGAVTDVMVVSATKAHDHATFLTGRSCVDVVAVTKVALIFLKALSTRPVTALRNDLLDRLLLLSEKLCALLAVSVETTLLVTTPRATERAALALVKRVIGAELMRALSAKLITEHAERLSENIVSGGSGDSRHDDYNFSFVKVFGDSMMGVRNP